MKSYIILLMSCHCRKKKGMSPLGLCYGLFWSDMFCVGAPCWFKRLLLWGAYVKHHRPPDIMPPGLPYRSPPPLLTTLPSCWLLQPLLTHSDPNPLPTQPLTHCSPLSLLSSSSLSFPLTRPRPGGHLSLLSFSLSLPICPLPNPLVISTVWLISMSSGSSPLFVSRHLHFLSVNDPSILTWVRANVRLQWPQPQRLGV